MSPNEKTPIAARIKGHLSHIAETLFGNGGWKSWILLPVCLLLCLGMYYGAKGISTLRLQSAQDAAQHMVAEVREGKESYYFNALSGREQYIYDALDKAISVYSSQTALLSFVPTTEEFHAASRAVLCDRPQYTGVLFDETALQTSRYSARITLAYADDARERERALPALAKEMLSSMPAELATPYDRALWIHDALVERATYLGENGENHIIRSDAYDALSGRPADGYAYASAYAYLCREAGISAEVVLGTANGKTHAWNALFLNESAGYVDVMWNDAPTKEFTLPFHGYFMLSKSEIMLDHTFDCDDMFGDCESANYYEYYGYTLSEDEAAATERLVSLLSAAAEKKASSIELLLPSSLADESFFKELLRGALATVSEDAGLPKIRTVNRIYHASDTIPARTIQLFYEE